MKLRPLARLQEEPPRLPVKPGRYFESGAWAVAIGAILAGARFFAYYPIEPATDIAEALVELFPKAGGVVVQTEDEISALAAAIGASWAGVKAFTATSGPGLSLMAEHISYAAMTETPVVIIDGMRAGPSTGQATKASQQDVMQAKWGAHGDYEVVAYSPSSVQELLEHTIKAFNAAERWRVPAFILADKLTVLLMENVTVPDPREVKVVNRKRPRVPPGDPSFKPFEPEEDLVPPMPRFGDGYGVHVTGVTHDERGVAISDDPVVHHRLVKRLCDKIRKNRDKIVEYETYGDEDPTHVIVAYGFVARAARQAVRMLREKGIRAALFRPVTLWPFPGPELARFARNAEKVLVAELNYGQVVHLVAEYLGGWERIELEPRIGELPPTPEELAEKLVSKA